MQNLINLLGKQVSFIHTTVVEKKIFTFEESGTVTNIVLDLNGDHQISLDDGDFYSMSKVLEFQIA